MSHNQPVPASPRADANSSLIQFKLERQHHGIPQRTLLADLQRVARRLKTRSLFPQQYKKHGRFTASSYRYRFGSWNAALVAAHLEPAHPRLVQDEMILNDIAAVATKLKLAKLPREVYLEHGKYGTTTISRRFGNWNHAVTSAGLTAYPMMKRNPSNQDLMNNLESVWRALGHQPRFREMAKPLSMFRVETYTRRFGTFRNALRYFVAHREKSGKLGVEAAPLPVKRKTDRQVSVQLRYRVLRRDHFKCRSCGRSPATDSAVQLHVDHVKPWSAGGETVLENLQTLCETCNWGKSNL